MAVPFAVLAIGGSDADVGYVAAAATVPVVVFLLWGGVVGDRLPRHKVMVAADVLQELVALAGMRFPVLPPVPQARMLAQLREGWREFISRRWLWAIVLEFAVLVAISTATLNVLGPLVAHAHLGGAHSWGAILASESAGAVLGGLAMIRFRPKRMLLAASLSVPAFAIFLFALAVPLSVPLLAVTAFGMGGCLEVFSVNWATTMQQQIPPATLSRVSAYDALGNYGLAPVGMLIAGPLATSVGTSTVLTSSGIMTVLLTAAILCIPEVRSLQRRQPSHTQAGQPA